MPHLSLQAHLHNSRVQAKISFDTLKNQSLTPPSITSPEPRINSRPKAKWKVKTVLIVEVVVAERLRQWVLSSSNSTEPDLLPISREQWLGQSQLLIEENNNMPPPRRELCNETHTHTEDCVRYSDSFDTAVPWNELTDKRLLDTIVNTVINEDNYVVVPGVPSRNASSPATSTTDAG